MGKLENLAGNHSLNHYNKSDLVLTMTQVQVYLVLAKYTYDNRIVCEQKLSI
jgi:hypothetical protein